MLTTHTVTEESSLRLDAYCLSIITHCTSRSQSKKWIKAGNVKVNQIVQSPAYFPKKGDIITIAPLQSKDKPYQIPITVHYEDEHCAVVHKPAGLHVSGNYPRTLRRALLHNLHVSIHPTRLAQPEPVHRLDRRTSGLVLIAKTQEAVQQLSADFAARRIHKKYRALVLGKATQDESRMSLHDKEAYSSWIVVQIGRSLHTEYLTELEITPHTGRTHQIRRHLHNAGFPILGDDLYHNGLIRTDKGLFLAATQLGFSHPITQKNIHIHIEPPPKFSSFIKKETKRYNRYHAQKS